MECVRVAVFVLLCNGGLYTLVTGNTDYYDYDDDYLSEDTEPDHLLPFFRGDSPRNVTTVVGLTITIYCPVENLGHRRITWAKRRYLNMLTHDIFINTPDNRISVVHPEGTDKWGIRILNVQKSDNGTYECFVDGYPLIKMDIVLNVKDNDEKELVEHTHSKASNGITSHWISSAVWVPLSLLAAALRSIQII